MDEEFQEFSLKIYSIKKYTFFMMHKINSNDCDKICETFT